MLVGTPNVVTVDRDRIAALRVEYEAAGLDESMVAPHPADQFQVWFGDAVEAGISQPNALVVATADDRGIPSARAVLMKDLTTEGLVFYTNSVSRKGRELAVNPHAACCFVWVELHRQVRMEGNVARVSEVEADAYFGTRPPAAKLAAAASAQSEVVPGRAYLDDRFSTLEAQFPDGAVPRPQAWGGYRIVPRLWEFWQGRPNRFHDRVRYRLIDGAWVVDRLAP